jgi:Ricin-type beta-trefoil lectin domain-like
MTRKWSWSALGSGRRRWRRLALPAVMLALVSVTIGLAQPAQASMLRWSLQGWTNNGGNVWADPHDAMVVEVVDWGIFDGDPVQMFPRRPTPSTPTETNQRWNFDRTAKASQFENVNAHGRCLDESAPRNGAVVYIYACTGAANQKWHLHQLGSDASGQAKYEVVNSQDNRCLDVKDLNGNPGARLQVWSCSGAWNQRFRVVLGNQ